MSIEIALAAGLALLIGALLVLLLLGRRPAADPLLGQKLADLQAGLERQNERMIQLVTSFERALAAEAQAIGERLAATSIDQTKALGEGMGRLAERIGERSAALEARVKDELAAIRLAFAETQTRLLETLGAETRQSRDLLDARLKELRESNETKLSEIEKAVRERLESAIEKRMSESFARVSDQFAQVLKAMTDVQVVAAGIGDLKRLFANIKTRGGWGETQLRAILDDILPPGAYETNKKLGADSGEVVEFAIRMPAEGGREIFLAIDAKFPTEDWERLLRAAEEGDAAAEREARRALERRIRNEAANIAAKYIRPPLTVDFAVLYLPTEGLYAEVARMPGLLEEIGRTQRVLILGPSLIPAMLRTIHLGHVTLALSEKAEMVRDLLAATKAEMQKMSETLAKLVRQLRTVGNTAEDAERRTRIMQNKLRGVEMIDHARAAALLGLEAGRDDGYGEGDEE